MSRLLAGVSLLGLLLFVALAGCSESTQSQVEPRSVDILPTTDLARLFGGELSIDTIAPDSYFLTNADLRVLAIETPCIGASDASCAPRDVSRFGLIPMNPVGAAYTDGLSVPSIEDVLEKGLGLREESPIHIAVRGTTAGSVTRCEWRGVARTPAQRETAVRFWLSIPDSDSAAVCCRGRTPIHGEARSIESGASTDGQDQLQGARAWRTLGRVSLPDVLRGLHGQ